MRLAIMTYCLANGISGDDYRFVMSCFDTAVQLCYCEHEAHDYAIGMAEAIIGRFDERVSA